MDSIAHQVRRLLADARDAHQVRVLFSNAGYAKAMRERDSYDCFDKMPPTTYMGRPFGIVPGQAEDVRAELVPERTVAVALTLEEMTGKAGALVIAGAKLNAAQLCDVIRTFLDADDATHWGAFEKELDAVVTRHGRFE